MNFMRENLSLNLNETINPFISIQTCWQPFFQAKIKINYINYKKYIFILHVFFVAFVFDKSKSAMITKIQLAAGDP